MDNYKGCYWSRIGSIVACVRKLHGGWYAGWNKETTNSLRTLSKTELPVVSVCMITYGHEHFISTAIESVLNQKTDFLIELIIVNDSSPDNTEIIIQNIIKKHAKGSLINYHKHSENLGMMANFVFALNRCNGKYTAICDGDDYWTDPSKLQRQVDFLEKNKEYILVGHNAKVNKDDIEENKNVRNLNTEYKDFLTSDLVQGNPFVSSMTMFENTGIENIKQILNEFIVGDWPLFTLLSYSGKCRFYSETVGFYRNHSKSVTSKNRIDYQQYKNEFVNRIKHAEFWNNYSGNKYDYETNLVKKKRSRTLVNIALKNGDYKTAIYYSQYIDIKELDKTVSKLTGLFLKMIFRIKKLISNKYGKL